MKMRKIEFDERARKELRKLDLDTQDRILKWYEKEFRKSSERQYAGTLAL